MSGARPSSMTVSLTVSVLVHAILLLLILADSHNSAKANPVVNHENQLHNKLNQIDRDGEGKRYRANHLKSLTNFGKYSYDNGSYSGRTKRQFDFDVDADHEEGVGTDVVASASANLYRSVSGETRLDGTARYSQHFGDYSGYGKVKVGGSLHFSHKYQPTVGQHLAAT